MTGRLTVAGVCAVFAVALAVAVIGAQRLDAETAACELTYDNFGKAFMDTYCVKCHTSANTGPARRGVPVGYDFDAVDGIAKESVDIVKEVMKKAMPPKDPKPTDDERAKLKSWIECEYPK